MSKGAKTGGRAKGAKNKRTLAVEEIVAKASRHPLETLAYISAGDAKKLGLVTKGADGKETVGVISLELQLEAAKELGPYLAPKRKAVEVSGTGGASPVFIIADKKPAQSWEQRAQEVRDEQQRQLQQAINK